MPLGLCMKVKSTSVRCMIYIQNMPDVSCYYHILCHADIRANRLFCLKYKQQGYPYHHVTCAWCWDRNHHAHATLYSWVLLCLTNMSAMHVRVHQTFRPHDRCRLRVAGKEHMNSLSHYSIWRKHPHHCLDIVVFLVMDNDHHPIDCAQQFQHYSTSSCQPKLCTKFAPNLIIIEFE